MDFIKATKKLWDAYFFGNIEECAELMEGAMPDCVVIGTGEHEIYHDLESFSEAFASEVAEREHIHFQYKDFWCKQKEISSDVYLVYGGLNIFGGGSEDTPFLINMDSRFTILYKCVDGVWKVAHTHQSMPNREQQDGEYYPKTLLDMYTTEKEKAEELRNLAENDSLTGLLNYKTFQKLFEESTDKNRWLIAIDLDDFKIINDTYGHPEGNYVLKSVANILRSSVRSDDYVCRMGGDEFLLLCKDVPSAEAMGSMIDRINDKIIKIGESKGYNISLSIGAAPVGDGDAFDVTFSHADKALYEAKRHGKHRWEIAELS